VPDFDTRHDITAEALPLLVDGRNILCIGVWNNQFDLDDLVLAVRLSVAGATIDNCPGVYNPDQTDTDTDGAGDDCDDDDDGDGWLDGADNCPLVPNLDQLDTDTDGAGDDCDDDDDDDGILDDGDSSGTIGDGRCTGGNTVGCDDNCRLHANGTQLDTDSDAYGDACDVDDDNDGYADGADNCPLVFNPYQVDTDTDGTGDLCDNDDDDDTVSDGSDNCPLHDNLGQADGDSDGAGDACDCLPGDNQSWLAPDTIDTLTLSQAVPPDPTTTLQWLAPAEPGAVSVWYDTLRATDPSDFAGAVCKESNGTGTSTQDTDTPPAGQAFYYLIRGENTCGSGWENMGRDSTGASRSGVSCP
jgi:hypothetical protein